MGLLLGCGGQMTRGLRVAGTWEGWHWVALN